MPNTSPICLGEIPKPVQTPAEIVLEEVTNGKVPKSISNIEPCAPSANTFLPLEIWSLIKYSQLIIFKVFKNSIASKNSDSISEISSLKL